MVATLAGRQTDDENRKVWVKRMTMIVVALVGLWLALVGFLWAMQTSLIYLPDHDLAPLPADVEEITLHTADGIEHRPWIVHPDGEPLARVVVFNGNAGNRSHRLPLARALAAHEMEVVLFDYRGYGDTAGAPSERGLVLDATAIADFASDHLPLIYFGESLGAAVAVEVAATHAPEILVLRSPFPSLVDVAKYHYRLVPVGLLLRDRFQIDDHLRGLAVPTLVVAGTADKIVRPELSRRVYEAAAGPKSLVEMEGLGHNDPELAAGDRLATVVRDFVDDWVDGPGG